MEKLGRLPRSAESIQEACLFMAQEKEIKVAPGQPASALPHAVIEAIQQGKVVFFGEFRGGVAVEFAGKGNRLFHQSKCSIETNNGAGNITVTEFLPDTVDWTTWKPPFAKGTMVYGVCRGLEESSGAMVATAKLIPV